MKNHVKYTLTCVG